MYYNHVPVLLDEVLKYLEPKPGQVIVDGTLGMAGHAKAIAQRVGSSGKVIGIEQDPRSLKILKSTELPKQIKIVQGNFAQVKEMLVRIGIKKVNGILLDLGVSTWQINSPDHGLSWQLDSPLDMRLNGQGKTAFEILRETREKDLANLLYNLADETRSHGIAKAIKENIRDINSTQDLARVIEKVILYRGKIHPATKTFMALRMAVNHELENLEKFLESAPYVLSDCGKIAVISFHSGEDRIVKKAFKNKIWQPVIKKPITPNREEIKNNPASRSAKLRVARYKI